MKKKRKKKEELSEKELESLTHSIALFAYILHLSANIVDEVTPWHFKLYRKIREKVASWFDLEEGL